MLHFILIIENKITVKCGFLVFCIRYNIFFYRTNEDKTPHNKYLLNKINFEM